jgi:23S rRNA (uracil1939-C5)-methyltransferase
VRITSSRSAHAVGEIEEVLEPSPVRVPPPCRHFSICGGCAYQHLPVELQTELKSRQVADALKRIGHIENPPLLPALSSPLPYSYRTRLELTACRDARGGTRLGFHRGDAVGVVFPVEACPIAAPALEELRRRLDGLLQASRIAPFDTRTRRGYLRRVVLRASSAGDTLVELRTATLDSRPLKELAAALRDHARLRGVVQVLDRGGRPAIGAVPHPLWGVTDLEETLLGVKLSFPAGAFAQTHAALAPALYEEALGALGDVRGQRCLDLFCGVGALSILMARSGALAVLGVEMEAAAAGAASSNARRAGVTACRFIQGDVESALAGISGSGDAGGFSHAVVNPPRNGLSALALQRLLRVAPRRIIYVSCDPATLARDLRKMCAGAYRLESVRPVDLFPQTAHIECVAALSLSTHSHSTTPF